MAGMSNVMPESAVAAQMVKMQKPGTEDKWRDKQRLPLLLLRPLREVSFLRLGMNFIW